MSFFEFLKKKETKTEAIIVKLSINELKEKVTNKLKNKEDLKGFEKELSAIKNNLGMLRKANDELLAKEPEGDYSKALIIGINNAKKALCTAINAGINDRKVNSISDFNEYLNEVSKLINNAHTALRKYSNAVNMAYKKEMLELIEQLESLNNKLTKSLEGIKKEVSAINDLKLVNQLTNELKSLEENKEALKKELSNTKEELEKKDINESLIKLKALNESKEYKTAKEDESRLKELNNDLNTINYRANTIMSYLAKILKSFRHNASSSLIESLNNETLKTISERKNDFQKLRDTIISELKNKHIDLKDKQALKAKQAIESDELISLSNQYENINESIKKIDLRILDEKKELEDKINSLKYEKQSLENKTGLINEKIKSADEAITDLTNRTSEKASETLNLKIALYK